ncbi:hypothetical protein [Flavobacterium sp. N3904]|uniref:hypothetical protein n=1 Tax=Flavobacterium sp. N3904 TaxID=2986835 RepID=UPI00222593A4|nr:hypothetical protein [Flavobacterium sp. N3904]
MKRKLLILNLSFVVLLLFSIVAQSFDSISHLQEKFSEKDCHHKYNSSAEITHQHHSFDHCYVCQFQFSSSITPKDFAFQFYTWDVEIPYSFTNTETIISFSGSLYSYRGPPNCI